MSSSKFMTLPVSEAKDKPKGFTSTLRKAYFRFLKIRGNPREIALGFALGIFIGMSPTFGFQTAIALFCAALLKWNKLSAALGVWITNPISAPFVYSISYYIGALVLDHGSPNAPPTQLEISIFDMVKKAPDIFWTLTVGGLILGIPLAIISYYIAYSAIVQYRENIRQKLALKRERIKLKRLQKRKQHNPKAEQEKENPTVSNPDPQRQDAST